MKNTLFALIDCNNFFASCEQVFRPDLIGHPVVVLSSNDGCVVARSSEAKALGIPMGAPAFKYREIFTKNKVIQFSANFELYGDISRRITEVLTSITPTLEVYSIDESFLDISELPIEDYTRWGMELTQTISTWIGVPVSIGIAPTKTLAKLASERAKKNPVYKGVLHIQPSNLNIHTSQTPIEDIWGIGRRLGPRLRSLGLATAADLANLPPTQARKLLGSVNGERLVRELNGQSCIPLEELNVDQKMISASRTFGQDTNQAYEVQAALASFVSRACTRMRSQNLMACRLVIFVSSSRHKPGYRKWSREVILAQPTSDTGHLTRLACKLFESIYESGVMYHRAGILLHDLHKDQSLQTDLLGYRDVAQYEQSRSRMNALDRLRDKYGTACIYYATEKLANDWQPRLNLRSPRYSTRWDELVSIK